MAKFHNVHCTNCGNVYAANQMAVNIDSIIRKHLEKGSIKMNFLKLQRNCLTRFVLGCINHDFRWNRQKFYLQII